MAVIDINLKQEKIYSNGNIVVSQQSVMRKNNRFPWIAVARPENLSPTYKLCSELCRKYVI